jgi:hypothetical protein
MRRVIRDAALAGSLAVLAACGTDVKAGTASVSLAGPVAVRGVIFRVVGPHGTIAVPSGQQFRVFLSAGTGDTVTVAVIASLGQTLTGTIVGIPVPNTKALPTVTLLQVAAADYSLKSATSYTLTIAP